VEKIAPLVDILRDKHGVGPVCHKLDIAPSAYYRQQQLSVHPEKSSQREQRDDLLKTEIRRVYDENHSVYGVRKAWRQLLRDNINVARCTVSRLMKRMGLAAIPVRHGAEQRPARKSLTAQLLQVRREYRRDGRAVADHAFAMIFGRLSADADQLVSEIKIVNPERRHFRAPQGAVIGQRQKGLPFPVIRNAGESGTRPRSLNTAPCCAVRGTGLASQSPS